jgi:hypothetical protein
VFVRGFGSVEAFAGLVDQHFESSEHDLHDHGRSTWWWVGDVFRR